MYNAESALEPVGNNSSLHTPSALLLFILHFYLCLCAITFNAYVSFSQLV